MSIPTIPSIETIKNRIVSDVETAINQTVPGLPIAFNKVLASAIAGIAYLLYQAILWVYKQIFPSSADYDNLVLLGAIVGISPSAAVAAVILCDVPGTGSDVSQGTLFIGSNNVTYRVNTTTAISGGVASDVPMTALTAGEIGNLANGEELSIVTTDLNLTGIATVTDTETPGSDAESDESFSARVSLRYRTRYITGSPGAYAINGLETPNFIWVGPYSDEDLPGTVNVYGRVDNQTDGIPTAAQLNTLEEYLNYEPDSGKAYRRPINDIINTLEIALHQFDLDVYINNGSAELNASIQSALEDFIATLEPYIQGVSDTRKNVLTNTDIAGVADDVAVQSDAKVTTVVLTDVVTGLTETNYTLWGGEFLKFRITTANKGNFLIPVGLRIFCVNI